MIKFFLAFTFLISTGTFVSVASAANARATLVCNRQKIQQSIRAVRSSEELKTLASSDFVPGAFKSSAHLTRIFHDLEIKTFGQRFLQLEDFPDWPGLTQNGRTIQFSSMTEKSLQQNLENPDIGAAFEIAHEMGHIIQNIRSPHGLERTAVQKPGQPPLSAEQLRSGMVFHSETDCIALEILVQAGYPLTNDIPKTLSLIANECRAEQPEAYCREADQIRQSAVRNYIQRLQK